MFATLIKTSVLATVLIGCATARPVASEAELSRTVTALRAQNTAYTRKIEELENQVFVLSAELDTRRSVESHRPADAAGAPTPALPETKLKPGRETPPPEAPEAPGSLVDEAVVEYAGAAAEEPSGKRPLLKLWGPGAPESDGSAFEAAPERPRAPPPAGPAPARAPDEAFEPSGRTAARGGGEVALYQSANNSLQAGSTGEAVEAFRTFVRRYPQHELADNAQYWLGECYYHRKEYSTALREFRRVVEKYPRGNKVPDALLKLGFSYLALGSARPGREALAELVRTYPRHPASGLAAAKLAELDSHEKKEAR